MHRLSIDPATRFCSCGTAVNGCVFWSSVLNDLRSRVRSNLADWAAYPVTAGADGLRRGRAVAQTLLWFGSPRALSFLARTNRSALAQLTAARHSWMVFDSVSGVDRSEVVVDSSKSPGRMRALYLERPASTYVVHLVRDGRAVAASSVRRTGVTVASAARSWRQANTKTLHMLRNVRSDHRILVRYEELCSDPLRTVNSIYKLLELPALDRIILPPVGDYHLIPGNPVLMSTISSVRVDERWKEEFRASALVEFDNEAGRLNRSLGYT